jgi:co-chaperonin GroES (HSP10)
MELKNRYILIRVDAETTETSSGLLLSSSSVRVPNTGTVEAIADGVTAVSVGDRVQFLRYAAIDGVEDDTRFCTEDMILARL